MNMPVLVDWLTLVLGPAGLILLIVAVRAKRRATTAGTQVTGFGQAAQWLAFGCLGLMVVLRLAVGV